MGGLFSRNTRTPREKSVRPVKKPRTEQMILDKPWRVIKWDESTRGSLKEFVQKYTPIINSVPEARILLVGDVGAGKSSFFNSISSIFRNYISGQANAGPNEKSMTLKYRTYKVTDGQGGQPLSFLLCDTMGLEENKEEQGKEIEGVDIKDIESIMNGYIPDGYQFKPNAPWRQDGEQALKAPLKERIHCVVFVVDSSTLPLKNLKEKDKKIIQIRNKANELGVPLMVLLTKVDRLCPNVAKDLQSVYMSNYLKEQIERASDFLGLQVSNVFPVKNYCCEDKMDMDSDILLLTAMQKMLRLSDDFFANFQ